MSKKTGKILITIGLLMLSAALCLTSYNLWTAHQAKKNAEDVAAKILEQTKSVNDLDYRFNPKMKMPTIMIDGYEYIGTLEIPALDLTLPVMSQWDYPSLRISPCRYKGSAYADDMIIAGHNYDGHFGRIKYLNPGDQIVFTDVNNHSFIYEVTVKEQLKPTDVEEMESGDWDLTLFTCTLGTQYRVTVRCENTYTFPGMKPLT